MEQDPLEALRRKIDQIDENILVLLNSRAKIALEVGKVKRDSKSDLYDPSREQRIYDRLSNLHSGPLPYEAVENVFREIISASHALQEPIKVAYLGPEATFTHLACLKYFGFSVTDLPSSTIKGVFDEVEKKRADFGVIPVENSTEGVVNHTLDSLVDSPLKIFGEIFLEITHHLLSKADRIETLKRVYSHPQAIAQCKVFLEQTLPNVSLIEVSSTARAAELAQNDQTSAAIASDVAARIYQLPIIEKRIEDNIQNITRFLIISRKMNRPSGSDKTSIIASIKDMPGALYKILKPFSDQKVNLTKIESRPSKKKPWEYLFHVDMVGHIDDRSIQAALEVLKSQKIFLKVLGAYPLAEFSTKQ